MAKGMIGEKVGMTQVFDSEGKLLPVTVLKVGPCRVTQVKTIERDGYSAVQLGYGEKKVKNSTKALRGHLAKAGIDAPTKVLREFREFGEEPELGSELKLTDIFQLDEIVKVSGVSKGKGFQGVVKRHGFSGGPETHGSRFQRHPGSIGANSTPSRVFKGMKMGGRAGGLRSTSRNLRVVRILADENLLFVTGSVPGSEKSIITIEKLQGT